MNANGYLVASCVVAALGAFVAWRRGRAKLALALAIIGVVLVLAIPIAMTLMIGWQTPGVGMVWLYTMPIAILYAGIANAAVSMTSRNRDS